MHANDVSDGFRGWLGLQTYQVPRNDRRVL